MRALRDFAAGEEPAGVHALAALDESPAPPVTPSIRHPLPGRWP
ncbi:hypothetical protein [Streptomyces sp. NBC_01214]|nr:hypothetical protein [Streptomyces sp. NBC_01214]